VHSAHNATRGFEVHLKLSHGTPAPPSPQTNSSTSASPLTLAVVEGRAQGNDNERADHRITAFDTGQPGRGRRGKATASRGR